MKIISTILGIFLVVGICSAEPAPFLVDQKYSYLFPSHYASPEAQKLLDRVKEYGFDKAITVYESEAMNGDAEAQFYMGYWYMEGKFFPQNDEIAFGWFKQSAMQDYAWSQTMIGIAYIDGSMGLEQSPESALYWLNRAAEQNDAMAQHSLGLYYWAKGSETKNLSTAEMWFSKAADQGFAEAMLFLSFLYSGEFGNADKADKTKALALMKQAAEGGFADAQYRYGRHFLDAVPPQKEAVEWMTKAARNGHLVAQRTLALMYQRGDIVEPNFPLALRWYYEAADQGDIQSKRQLGFLYLEGIRVEKNVQTAANWLTRASESGDAVAMEMLMFIYSEDDGDFKANLQESFRWAQEAAFLGREKAQMRLMHAYGEGLGVEKDMARSYAWGIVWRYYGGDEKMIQSIDHLYTVDDKVSGHRLARRLHKEIKKNIAVGKTPSVSTTH